MTHGGPQYGENHPEPPRYGERDASRPPYPSYGERDASRPPYPSYGQSAGGPGWGAPSSGGPTTGGASQQQGPPVCPRHPGVVTYVRCQRCGRPTCPQCQRAASVGVHCVDCAKAAQARIRGPRTVAGAKVRGGNPVVTYALIGLCVVVFLGQMVGQGWVEAYGYFVPVLGERQPWRFLSSAFLHVGIWHIFLNMYAMYLVGPMLEHVLGRARYLTLWILAAIGGSVAVLLLADPTGPSWLTPVAGASGAVFGMFGALALTMRRMKRSDTQILVIIGINVVLGFVIPGISWQGHLGGLVVGAALAAAYLFAPKQHRTVVAVAASVGMAVLLVALAVAKYAGVF